MDEYTLNKPEGEEIPADDGQEEVVAPEDADLEGEGEGEEEPGDADRDEESQHEINARMKAARLQGAEEAKKQLRKEYDEHIAGLGVINPYTKLPFASFKEFEDYGKRYRREQLEARAKKENRPVEEIEEEEQDKAFIREQRKRTKAEAERAQDAERLKADLVDFISKYPGVDAAKLEANPKFKKFAGSRLYKEPLATLYEDFREFVTDTESAAIAKKDSKDRRSSGAGGTSKGTVLSAEEQRALDEWNERYPQMKMTAAEFKKS